MGTLHTFRARPAVPVPPPPCSAETRRLIEDAAQAALDTADRLLAILDRLDGDADLEDGGDAEPDLGAPENQYGSQVVWMRGNDRDREAETVETVLPEVVIPFPPLPWGGRGNLVAAAGVALLDLVAGR